MSNLIPEGWEIAKVGDAIVSADGGVSVNSENRVKNHHEYGVLKTSSVFDGHFSPNEHKAILPSEMERTSTSPKQDHIIFSRMNTPLLVGQSGYVHKDYDDLFLPDRLWQLKVNKKYSSKWLSYVLREQYVAKMITDAATGTSNSMKNIAKPNLMAIPINCPPLPEQQKIAAILTSVDEVIEKTQAQIDKLKDLKSGMMQELLTKGVGIKQGEKYMPHTEFKDSPVGRIPKSWEVVKLGDTGKWRGGGTPSKTNKEFWSGSIPWVSPKDMKLDLISRTQDHVSAKAIKESSTNLIPKGSLLMVVRSGILQHTLPVAIAGCDLTVNQDIKALTVSERYDTRFIFHYLKAHNHKVLRATLKAGNTVESIDFNEFSKFVIPSPPFEEQVKIADLVDSVANKISSKVSKLNQTSNLKKALMQDLLTGKVRVKVDNHLVV